MSLYNSYSKIDKDREAKRKENLETNKQISKDKLEKVVKTKLTTTFIGALDSFEKTFGYLWGHGKSSDLLTDSEARFRELWVDVRNEILNKGNSQLRATLLEINEYEVLWQQKKYFFEIGKEIGNE